MTLSPARIRRWLLWAAPMMALFGLRWGAGGAGLGLFIWMGLGFFLLRRDRYPYPRKRKTAPANLAFSAALCACSMAGAFSLMQWIGGERAAFSLSSFLALNGAIGFSLPLGAWTIRCSFPRLWAWIGTGLFCALFLLLMLR